MKEISGYETPLIWRNTMVSQKKMEKSFMGIQEIIDGNLNKIAQSVKRINRKN